MKTPAGRDCRHYYADFHRGRNRQECRLLDRAESGLRWRPGDCTHCSVPDILWANSSPYLELHAVIRQWIFGLGRRVEVSATCGKHNLDIPDPYIGCEACAGERPDFTAFLQAEDDE